jgi:hypothetical protein
VASFAAFSDLTNDECTRTFLCMEIGAGHQEVSSPSSFLNIYISTFEEPEFDISPSYVRSRTRLHPPCVLSARKNIMNSHVSMHRSPGSSSIVLHNNVHRPKLKNIQNLSPLLRPWRVPQARTRTLSPLSRVSPRTSSPR